MCCSDGYQAGQVPRVSVTGAGQEAGAELQLLQEETIKGDYQVRIVIQGHSVRTFSVRGL